MLQFIRDFDQKAMLAVVNYRQPTLTKILRILTYTAVGKAWFFLAILLIVLEFSHIKLITEQTTFHRSMLAALAAWVIGTLMKRRLKRFRPFQRIENYKAQVSSPLNDSLPSLHAGGSFAFFVALGMNQHPLTAYVGIWAVLVTFSRYYLGVHYPSDIFAGIMLGILCGSFIN